MNSDDLGSKAVTISIALSVVLTLAAAGAGIGGIGEARGESQYTGEVADFENERGIIFKTTQVHLKTDTTSSSAETFCVHDDYRDEQVDVIRDAASNGDRVTITYERPLYVPVWECDQNLSIITDVEVHDE